MNLQHRCLKFSLRTIFLINPEGIDYAASNKTRKQRVGRR